jgi:two-component system chemotaxis sensor kinase CheA
MSDSDIVKDFLVESYENLDRLDRDLVGLEKNPHDKEALAGVFRTIHTIKGTCGFLAFNKLEKVAHVGENLLTLLRDGKLTLNPEITTGLLGMVDAVRQMLKVIETTGNDGEVDYPELRETLTRLQTPGDAQSNPPAAKLTQPENAASEAAVHPETLPSTLISTRSGSSAPGEEEAATGIAAAETEPAKETEPGKGKSRPESETSLKPMAAKDEEPAAAHPAQESRSRDAVAETIRVGVNVLDKLMTLVGELVLARNQLLQLANIPLATPICRPYRSG